VDVADLLAEAYGRLPDLGRTAVEGLTPAQLSTRVGGSGNSVAWLLWHLTRVQDDHVSEVAGQEQLWTAGGWHARFGLPFDAAETGYRHGPDDVAAVRVESPDLLTGYLDAVVERSLAYVRSLSPGDLDRVVDESWDPPVTLGVRLVSVLDDDLQHLGQAAYARGLLTAG
jgi:hypothetical protein